MLELMEPAPGTLLARISAERDAWLDYETETISYRRSRTGGGLRAVHEAWEAWQEAFALMNDLLSREGDDE